MLSLLGMIGGIWADKFDHMAAVTNFIVTPLSFLSGTFYSDRPAAEDFRLFALANPFFYMIDGFRYGFIGHADGSVWIGVVLVGTTNLFLWPSPIACCHRLQAQGLIALRSLTIAEKA